MPAAIIAVNLGGLALARKLRAQINSSVELLVRADTQITDLPGQKEEVSEPVAVQIPLVPLANAALEADRNAEERKEQRKASLTPSESSLRRDRRKSSFAPSDRAEPRDRRKSSLTFAAIKQLAVQTDASGRATAARSQARKVLALQKAARDLQIVRRLSIPSRRNPSSLWVRRSPSTSPSSQHASSVSLSGSLGPPPTTRS